MTQGVFPFSPAACQQEWVHFLKELLTEHYAQAEKVVIVMDNLNTHSPASDLRGLPT